MGGSTVLSLSPERLSRPSSHIDRRFGDDGTVMLRFHVVVVVAVRVGAEPQDRAQLVKSFLLILPVPRGIAVGRMPPFFALLCSVIVLLILLRFSPRGGFQRPVEFGEVVSRGLSGAVAKDSSLGVKGAFRSSGVPAVQDEEDYDSQNCQGQDPPHDTPGQGSNVAALTLHRLV